MHFLYNKTAYIKELQKIISEIYENKKFIAQTGIYDDDTKEAVKQIQVENNIKPTGVVDFKTHKYIYNLYYKKVDMNKIKAHPIPKNSFPIFIGEYSDLIYQIKMMLQTVLSYYNLSHNLDLSNFYSIRTENAIKQVKKIYLLDETNYIDEEFYLRLFDDYNFIIKTAYN